MLLIPISFLALRLIFADDSETLIRRAVQAQQTGDYQAAANGYRAALELQPNDGATHVNLGVVLVQLAHFDEAIAQYEAAQKLLPGDVRIALNIALAYEKSGRIGEAATRFEALHSGSPQDPKVTMLLADCDLQLGRDGRVIELLEPLELENEDDHALAYMLGMAFLHRQRIPEGQMRLDKILRQGDTAEARFMLGTRMFEAGDYPAAVKELAGAIELDPRLPQVQSYYGRALLNTGDPAAAQAAFRLELAQSSNDYQANLALGQIAAARKEFRDGVPLLRLALRINPESAAAKLALADCLMGSGHFSEALPYAEAAVKALPASSDAHHSLAMIYAGLHRRSDAARERQIAQRMASAADPGPELDKPAPDFELVSATGEKRISLRSFRGKSPVVLIFGSYSCPNFRSSAGALRAMERRYGRLVPFLLVYIREAHSIGPSALWQSTRNDRENVALPPALNISEKQDHANMCTRSLHLPFEAVVDGMDGEIERAYNAWPSRVFIIDKDGRVAYGTRLTELAFQPEEMEAVLPRLCAVRGR